MTIYYKNELISYIKSIYNSLFECSVKHIDLDISKKFICIKYKIRNKDKNTVLNVEIFTDAEFERFIIMLFQVRLATYKVKVEFQKTHLVVHTKKKI